MGHHSCCNQQKVKRGLWSPEEDEKLVRYISSNGYGCWSEVPEKAGLQRCGKSCRLRWINYLRPDIKRGRFTPEEEKLIIRLHEVVGNRWAHIASHMPGRTDNEIKNYWNSWIKKKIRKPTSTSTIITESSKASSITTTLIQPNNITSSCPFMSGFGSDPTPNRSIKASIFHMQRNNKPTLISSSCPSFMFDTSTSTIDLITNHDHTTKLISHNHQHEEDCWNSYMQTINTNSASLDLTNDNNNYMPNLVESMENLVSTNQDHQQEEDIRFGLLDQCLPKLHYHENDNELVGINQWGMIESQSCPNFVYWDNVEEVTLNNLSDEMHQNGPSSSSIGALVSSFPSL